MQWLFENPLANMPGPAFLLLYIVLMLGVILILRIVANQIEKGDDPRRLPIPDKPNPLQIAYLRGGDQEVTRTAVIDLLQQGRLKPVNKNGSEKFWSRGDFKLQTANAQPSDVHLSEIQQFILLWFQIPREVKSLFDSTIRSEVSKETKSFQRWMETEKLQVAPEGRAYLRNTLFLSILLLEVLGFYKLTAAWIHGRPNYWYLILLMVITLLVIPAFARHRRLSRRGQDYLKDLQTAFGSLRSLQEVEKRNAASAVTGNDLSLPMLAMGIFGVSALEGSSLDPYFRSFRKAEVTGSGCSSTSFSSCGSTGCGGSSCGGGGGGCGGCGGCGGGD